MDAYAIPPSRSRRPTSTRRARSVSTENCWKMADNASQPKPLTAKQMKAAVLVAEDAISNERIAEECGVSSKTLYNWKLLPEFQAVVREKTQELDDAVSQLQFAKRRGRLEALNAQATDYQTIVKERAEWFGRHEPDVPGGKTGRIIRQEKVIGTGRNAVATTEYALDKGLEAQFDNVLVQIARERGEWLDKRELTGANGTPLVPITEIVVNLPTAPPEIVGDDDDD